LRKEKIRIREIVTKTKRIIKSIYFKSFYLSILIDIIFKDSYNYNLLKEGNLVSAILNYLILYAIVLLLLMLISKIFSDVSTCFNSDITVSLQSLLEESSEFIYLVSPFLNPGNLIIEEIIKKRSQGVEITIIHNTNEINKSEFISFFNRVHGLGIRFVNNPNLHAKIYCSEKDVIITSMNLTTSSIENSLEAGISTKYRVLRRDVLAFINDILASDLTKETTIKNAKISIGFCIKTKQRIAFNPKKPVAYHVYRSDRNPLGKYCHYCGVECESSIEKPFCEEHNSMLLNN